MLCKYHAYGHKVFFRKAIVTTNTRICFITSSDELVQQVKDTIPKIKVTTEERCWTTDQMIVLTICYVNKMKST